MFFPSGVILIWSGTNASIPTGWERVTDLDSKYIKGTADSTNPGDSGGNATHTHTSTAHTHTMSAHTHVINIPAATGSQTSNNANTSGGVVGRYHDHANFNSGAVSGASIGSTAATYQAVSNDPPYYEVIFITPTSDTDSVPDDVIYLYEDSDPEAESGHYLCDGTDSTPNLVGKYLKGATAAGDGGGTGGSTTNTHPIDHAHTQSHSHSSATSGGSTSSFHQNSNERVPAASHTHSVTLGSNSTGTGTTSIDLVTSETVEPAYTKLLAVQNQNTDGARQGIIALWLGTLAAIPNGWQLLDGVTANTDMRGRYMKITATTGEVADTGGSNSHTHAAQGHTHSNIAHTHSFGSLGHSATNKVGDGGAGFPDSASVTHAASNSDSGNYTLASANTSAASSSNEPQFVTVAFIKRDALGTATNDERDAKIHGQDSDNDERGSKIKGSWGIIFPYFGTNASIPSGWNRVTDLDSKYIKGYESGANDVWDTGGNATHTHTVSGTHSHTATAHTHTISTGYTVSRDNRVEDPNTLEYHNHADSTSPSSSGGSLTAVASSYAAYSNDPPYYEMIWIAPDNGVPTVVPDGVSVLFDSTSVPSGFTFSDGTGGTPDLRNKFLKGAEADGDSGGTGGSTTNLHDLTHTHTVNTHTHSNGTTGAASNTNKYDTWGGAPANGRVNVGAHTHTVALNTKSDSISATAPTLTTTETVEPAYVKLMIIENTSGGDKSLEVSMVALFLGDLGNIPDGWVLCDGTNDTTNTSSKYLKVANSSGELGDTGGSNTHTHSSDTHTHTSSGHTHDSVAPDHTAWASYDSGYVYTAGGVTGLLPGDTHTVTYSSEEVTYSTETTSGASSNNEPEYVVVAFVMFAGTSDILKVSGVEIGSVAKVSGVTNANIGVLSGVSN